MAFLFRVPSRMEDLALFTRHVSGAMIARAPLPDILRAFVRDSEGGELARAVDKITDRVESGAALSEAMEEHAAVFPVAYRRLVRLGEQGKSLGGVMKRLAENLEEGLKTYEYFRRAAIYPLIVSALLLIDVCFVLAIVAPKFEDIYQSLGAELPILTTRMFALSDNGLMFAAYGAMLLTPIVFLICAVLGLRLRGVGYGRMALQMPVIGPVVRHAESARFAYNLSLLIDNRVPMAEALGLMADSAENAYVRDAIGDLQRRYESGERLGDLIASQPLFPASMAAMVSSAEDQGGLAETLRGLGKFYSERVSHGLIVIREVFEPIMLLLIGLCVALTLGAMYAPLFDLPRAIM